jgi:hypothetical protein
VPSILGKEEKEGLATSEDNGLSCVPIVEEDELAQDDFEELAGVFDQVALDDNNDDDAGAGPSSTTMAVYVDLYYKKGKHVYFKHGNVEHKTSSKDWDWSEGTSDSGAATLFCEYQHGSTTFWSYEWPSKEQDDAYIATAKGKGSKDKGKEQEEDLGTGKGKGKGHGKQPEKKGEKGKEKKKGEIAVARLTRSILVWCLDLLGSTFPSWIRTPPSQDTNLSPAAG